MWQSLQTITDYKEKHSRERLSDTSLTDELNFSYACFETNNTEMCMSAQAVPDDCVITLSAANMSKTFKQVNIHKDTGPDGLPGCVLWACTDQLARVFTDIFNLSLTESVIHKLTWSKHTKTVVKKAWQCLCPLRRPKRFGMGPQILKKLYSCTIESILTDCINAWYGNCSASDRRG